MDYQRLKIFITVCGTGNFTRAAQELGISQPAVSLSMKELERSLGLTLFERNENDEERTMSLTSAAEAFLPFALRVIKSHDEIDAVFHADTIGYDKVTIGAGRSACELVVPQILTTLRAIYPKIEFEVLETGNEIYGDAASGAAKEDVDVLIKTVSRCENGRFVLEFKVEDDGDHPIAEVIKTLLEFR